MRSRLVKCFDTLLCDGGSCVCILFVTKPTWRNLTVLSRLAELKTNNLKVPNCFKKKMIHLARAKFELYTLKCRNFSLFKEGEN